MMAEPSAGAGWADIVGIACLANIGFTKSLFIGALAFTDEVLMNQMRPAVLSGSLVSCIAAAAILGAVGAGGKKERV
jgi:Na+:H+ antiporter, NhaA family